MDTTNIELLLTELIGKQDEIIQRLEAIESSCETLEELKWWSDDGSRGLTFAAQVINALNAIESNTD